MECQTRQEILFATSLWRYSLRIAVFSGFHINPKLWIAHHYGLWLFLLAGHSSRFCCFLDFRSSILAVQKACSCRIYDNKSTADCKKGIHDYEAWFVSLEEIKDVIVKIGFVDMLFGTGKLYPITSAYPYEPKPRAYTRGGMYRPMKVFNVAEQKYEEIPEIELYRKSQTHPRIEGLKEPYAVQKFLREVIFGAGTNFVSCKYCNYRYDLNKEGKCPHCGGPHPQHYSL